MKFLREIQAIDDDEKLKRKVRDRIRYLEAESRKKVKNYGKIGYLVDNVPSQHETARDGNVIKFMVTMRCFYNYFIPKDTQMVYGITYNKSGMAWNAGDYYYVDDQDYLYDFCKYIQDKDILDDYEFFGYMRDFLRKYFGVLKLADRDDMNKTLVDANNNPFPTTVKHSIKSFKGKGAALCSEYAVLAQNILKLFGYVSYVVAGHEKRTGSNPGSHAFNMVSFQEEGEDVVTHAVIDFINSVSVYDELYRKVGEEPFIGLVPTIDDAFVNQLVNEERHLVFSDYAYYMIGDVMMKLELDRERDFYIGNAVVPDKGVNLQKTYTKS